MTTHDAIAWIAKLFEVSVSSITPNTVRTDIATWDSLGMLTLMARLDEDFGILLSESELLELRSVSDVLKVLQRHGHLDHAVAA